MKIKPITVEAEDFPEHQASDYDKDGFSENDGDCNDQSSAIGPGFIERCDGLDNDCDGEIDEDPIDGAVWYEDGDGDAYGVEAYFVLACTRPDGYVGVVGDCDDSNANINPGSQKSATATLTTIAMGSMTTVMILGWQASGSIYYGDADGDGYGSGTTFIRPVPPQEWLKIIKIAMIPMHWLIQMPQRSVMESTTIATASLTKVSDPNVELSTGVSLYLDTDFDGYGDGSQPHGSDVCPCDGLFRKTDWTVMTPTPWSIRKQKRSVMAWTTIATVTLMGPPLIEAHGISMRTKMASAVIRIQY